jgi:DNA-binding NarL/FixJ family response regulator
VARVRVVLADDHRLMLEVVRVTLEEDGDFDVVGTARSAAEALRVVASTEPDVIVLDVRMPGSDGLSCLQQLKERDPELTVVILSGIEEPRIAQRALRLGASAFVKKQVDPRDLAAVLRQAVEATVLTQASMLGDADALLHEVQALLTPGELAVLTSLGRGLVNKQIAAELSIAPQTVKFHLTNVYRKLGVANRTEAIRYAFEHELVELEVAAV